MRGNGLGIVMKEDRIKTQLLLCLITPQLLNPVCNSSRSSLMKINSDARQMNASNESQSSNSSEFSGVRLLWPLSETALFRTASQQTCRAVKRSGKDVRNY